MSTSNMSHIVLTCCLLSIRLICINCVFGIPVLCTLLCWLAALSWCGTCYAKVLLKILWLYMTSILQIHMENISVPFDVVLTSRSAVADKTLPEQKIVQLLLTAVGITVFPRYDGHWPVCTMCIKRHTLHLMQNIMGSQCRSFNACVI